MSRDIIPSDSNTMKRHNTILVLAIAASIAVPAAVLANDGQYRLFDSFENAVASGTAINGLASTSGRFNWAA